MENQMNPIWNKRRVSLLTGGLAIATVALWAYLAFIKKL